MDRRRFISSAAILGTGLSLPAGRYRTLFAASLPADLTSLSASDLSAAIYQKHASCAEVMQSYLVGIHNYNPV